MHTQRKNRREREKTSRRQMFNERPQTRKIVYRLVVCAHVSWYNFCMFFHYFSKMCAIFWPLTTLHTRLNMNMRSSTLLFMARKERTCWTAFFLYFVSNRKIKFSIQWNQFLAAAKKKLYKKPCYFDKKVKIKNTILIDKVDRLPSFQPHQCLFLFDEHSTIQNIITYTLFSYILSSCLLVLFAVSVLNTAFDWVGFFNTCSKTKENIFHF